MSEEYAIEEEVEDRIIDFVDELKMYLFHPRKRFQLLKAYVSALSPEGHSEDKIYELTSHQLSEITRLLPSPTLLSPYIGIDHRNEIAIGHLVESLNDQLMKLWLHSAHAKEYFQKATLFLQVEVVKASHELDEMEDTDTTIIRQDQEITTDEDDNEMEEEEIEQGYDLEQEKEDLLESEVQNLAFILGQHTTNKIPENDISEKDSTLKQSVASDIIESKQSKENTLDDSEKQNIKHIRSQLQKNLTTSQPPSEKTFAEGTKESKVDTQPKPEGRGR